MNREQCIEELLNRYYENPDDFIEDIYALDEYNGFLGAEMLIPMSEFDSYFENWSARDIVRAAKNGHCDLSDDWFYVDGAQHIQTFLNRDDYYGQFLEERTVWAIFDYLPYRLMSWSARDVYGMLGRDDEEEE